MNAISKLASSYAKRSVSHTQNNSMRTNFSISFGAALHRWLHTPTKSRKSFESPSFLLKLKCQFASPYPLCIACISLILSSTHIYSLACAFCRPVSRFQFITIHHYIICISRALGMSQTQSVRNSHSIKIF